MSKNETVDRLGSAYVAGTTTSTNFPTTPGVFQTVNSEAAPGETNFVTKLAPSGAALTYSTYLGGSSTGGIDVAYAIAVDGTGNAFVGGITSVATYPVTPGAFQTTRTA